MTEVRYRVDPQRPCLACGAPWRIEEQALAFDRSGVPVRWELVMGECADRCWLTDLQAYNSALRTRRDRGW